MLIVHGFCFIVLCNGHYLKLYFLFIYFLCLNVNSNVTSGQRVFFSLFIWKAPSSTVGCELSLPQAILWDDTDNGVLRLIKVDI